MRLAAPLATSRWARARWLVLAPHPDDETLGAGALIAEAAACGRLAGVAYLTDGEGSHPLIGAALADARRAEAACALRRLTGARLAPSWIGWPDGHPLTPCDPGYERDARAFGRLLRTRHVDAVAVTARDEPHCDHAAAYRFAHAATRFAGRRIAVFEYLVWGKATDAPARSLRTGPLPASRRRAALQAHRSQLTPRFGKGFRLPGRLQHMRDHDTLYMRETLA